LLLPYLRKRSKIIEIVAARDIVFALSQSGVCAAFSRGMVFLPSCNPFLLPLAVLRFSFYLSRDKSENMLSEWKSR
jgi:hypothetical protein